MRDNSIKLGDRARDEITGYEGIVVAITEWLNGCCRLLIQPEKLHEGKIIDSQTFDVEQCKKVKSAVFAPPVQAHVAAAPARQLTGGDRPAPVQRRDVR